MYKNTDSLNVNARITNSKKISVHKINANTRYTLFLWEIKNKSINNAHGIYFHSKDVYQNQNFTIMPKEAQGTFNY
jgi:hypothetical protein